MKYPHTSIYLAIALFVTLLIAPTAHAQPTEPEFLDVPKNLATPIPDHKYLMPVVVIAYLPTNDGINLDQETTGDGSALIDIGAKIDAMNGQIKYALEEGSRYHGYKDPNAKPALGYKIVACIVVYEKLPKSDFEVPWNKGIYRPDYKQILTRFNAQDYVENQGVKEFWLWGYHHKDIEPVESDMASPITGDISNSERTDDLPLYNKTYVLFNYNYSRTAAESEHVHGHHLEAVLTYINQKQDGNTDLWQKQFCAPGRCGWTHMPPNTTKDYDYANPTPVESDIEDWTPDRTGQLKTVSEATWRNLPYKWPHSTPPPNKTEANFYIYWRQNIPGIDNNIQHGDRTLTNWWQFIGDWDNANTMKIGLHAAP